MTLNSKVYIKWNDITTSMEFIYYQMRNDNWIPDIIIGIANGGVIPATLLSKRYKIPVKTISIQLRDGHVENLQYLKELFQNDWQHKNVLFVDDINDTGATFNHIIKELQNYDANIKSAVIHNNLSSSYSVDYSAITLDKSIEDQWIVYPWEFLD